MVVFLMRAEPWNMYLKWAFYILHAYLYFCPISKSKYGPTLPCCWLLCWAQRTIFQRVLDESVELKVPPGEICWTREVGPLPYIAVRVRKCLTLADQYFRKLLLVSVPISRADKDVIAVCVCVRMRLELKWIRQQGHSISPHHLIPCQASGKWNSNPTEQVSA